MGDFTMNDAKWMLQVLKMMFEAETPKEAFDLLMCNYEHMRNTEIIMALQVVYSKWKVFEQKAIEAKDHPFNSLA
jgi:hypothetical protein